MSESRLRTLDKLDLTLNQKMIFQLLDQSKAAMTSTQIGKYFGLKYPTNASWANMALKSLERRKMVKKLEDKRWVAVCGE